MNNWEFERTYLSNLLKREPLEQVPPRATARKEMIHSVLDILALRMTATEKFIRLVWIVYLTTEVYTWLSWIWYAYPNVWHQELGATAGTIVRLIQELAYITIVYFVLQLARKLLTENQK